MAVTGRPWRVMITGRPVRITSSITWLRRRPRSRMLIVVIGPLSLMIYA
jgi:hypothetical protein